MTNFLKNSLLCITLTFSLIKTVHCISCYQCSGSDSSNPFQCNEFLDSDTDLQPQDCSSIHNAQYCIKLVGRFEGDTLSCYQCNSSTTMECGDGLINFDGGALTALPCDHVYNAQYCIKQIGGISTKRYCSSLDLGNQCNYVQQPGDKLEYRTCVYTCSSDGCNGATTSKASRIALICAIFGAIKYFFT